MLLRKIRQGRWLPSDEGTWIPNGEIQADPLGDLSTTNGKLSVWVVSDDRANLDRVVAALAANCDKVSNIDYLIFNEETVVDPRFKVELTKGNSHDKGANTKWHRDLVELTAGKLVELARSMFHCCEKRRLLPKDVAKLIAQAVANEWIDPHDLSQPVRDKVMPLVPASSD